jgi:capsular exopolysaccharide synthesis family protein
MRRGSANWLRPRSESRGAIRYLATAREWWWLIVLTTVIAVGVAAAYAVTAQKVFEATAELLITPVSSDDSATAGLGLITESSDPTQVVSTAARLVDTPAIATATRAALRVSDSAQDLLDKITVEPVAQSNLVAVRARSDTAEGAARLANAFADSAVNVRTAALHQEIDDQLPALQSRLHSLPADQQSGEGTLGQHISDLQALAAAPDPTVRVASRALAPDAQASPHVKLAIAAGIIGGLIVGIGAAFAAQALDPRLRREEQLREIFRLPMLARIPRLAKTRRRGPLTPERLTPAAIEAYRTLRATVSATSGEQLRSVLFTSSAPGEGKTTSAINFAESLAMAGHRVLLIEGDLRRPTISAALGVQPVVGIGAVLVNRVPLSEAIIATERYGDDLCFLLAEQSLGSLADRLSLPTARELVAEAEEIADYVVIDSPPLTEVTDALPLAQEVDAVVIMARIGASRLNRLQELGEILEQGGVQPAGLVVIGRERAAYGSYHVRPDVPAARRA